MQENFYIHSLITELHPVTQVNISPTFHYIKSFTQSTQDITFFTIKNYNKTLESNRNL